MADLDLSNPQPWATASGPLGMVGTDPATGPMGAPPPSMPMGAPTAGMEGMSPDADPNMENAPIDMSRPSNIEAVASAVHHGRMARAARNIIGALGGGTTYKLEEQGDGSVNLVPHEATSGEKWARVAQAALSGFAHGWASGQGPGGPARALAAGVDTGTQMAAQRQQEGRDLAEKYTQQNRQKQLFDANMKVMTLRTAQMIHDQDRAQFLENRADNDHMNATETFAKNTHADMQYFDTKEDAIHAMNDPNNPLFQAFKDHRVTYHDMATKENPNRTAVVITPADHMNDLYKQDYTPRVAHFDPNDLKKDIYYTDGETILGNHKTVEEMNGIRQKQEFDNEQVKTQLAHARLEKQKADDETALRKTQQAAAAATTKVANANVELIGAKTKAINATIAGGGGVTDPNIAPPDARFPARDYFPQGEPGIMPYDNPKNRTYKVDRDATTRENGALSVLSNVDQLKNIFGVDANGNPTKQLTGDIKTAIHDKTATELLGLKDQDSDLGRLIKAVDQINQASIAIHGRNSTLVNKSIKESLNNFLNDPKAMIAMADQEAYSARHFVDAAQQRRNYGGFIPESRRFAVADDWWKKRGGTIIDRGNESREPTIHLVLDNQGHFWEGPQSGAAQILATRRLGALNAVQGVQ